MDTDDSFRREEPFQTPPGGGISSFPGRVALIQSDPQAEPVTFVVEATDDNQWAIELTYRIGSDTVVTRSVRSAAGLDPRGLPVESLVSALLTVEEIVTAGRSRSEPSSARAMTARAARRQLAELREVSMSVMIDGEISDGVAISTATNRAVFAQWHGQMIFLAGPLAAVDRLAVRMAEPVEVVELFKK